MAENKTLEHLPEVRAAVAALSPEDREVLAAVQTSPFKLTAPEQFKEFAANIDYFVFEPNIHDLNDLGWRYLAQHMDMKKPTYKGKELLPLSVIDAARDGDSQAVDQILRYYEGYINKLCTRTLCDPDGQPHVRVDEYMKRRLEIKLIHSIVSMS